MGRVKKYSRPNVHKHKKSSKGVKEPKFEESGEDVNMTGHEGLTVAKRKQIFKKKDRRSVKQRIKELRVQSLKLKKKNLDQKSQKKEIAHEIRDLQKQLKQDGVDEESSD